MEKVEVVEILEEVSDCGHEMNLSEIADKVMEVSPSKAKIFGHGGLLWDIIGFFQTCWLRRQPVRIRDYREWRDS